MTTTEPVALLRKHIERFVTLSHNDWEICNIFNHKFIAIAIGTLGLFTGNNILCLPALYYFRMLILTGC